MKLSSLFKFKRKEIDIHPLLESIFDKVESNLLLEFQKDIYCWSKEDNIKQYECFILSKFLIDYSFPISYKDLDKNIISNFNKTTDDIFVELHDKKYFEILSYKDMKTIVDEKYNSYTILRKENKAPECWSLIYSHLSSKKIVSDIKLEILGLQKAIKLLEKKARLVDLISKFKNAINQKNKEIESFDLAEILFRQNIRFIKKELLSADIPNQLSSKK